MAKKNSISLAKIKKQLALKNIKIGGKLNFQNDASNKIFQLCKTANQTFLMLSFQNNPSEFQKYLKADKALNRLKITTPEIIEKNKSQKYLLINYYPTNNSSKYFKKNEIKKVLQLATQNIINLQKPRKKFIGVPTKPKTNLIKNASQGIETYIEYFDHKIQIGFYLNKLIQQSIKKNFHILQKYKPTLTHGDYFLENLIYYKKELYVIDHQDLHYNHPYLDIASLVFDARRLYSSKIEEKLIKDYARKSLLSLPKFRDDIHLVSLARNLRILGNWISLYRSGKPHYLKKFRKNTWLQILKHVEHLRLWDLRELFQEIYYKTK
tara:strand:+ start:210 stop:1178 length:969 start_codon:yes stop_codon:yes gene_type:complete